MRNETLKVPCCLLIEQAKNQLKDQVQTEFHQSHDLQIEHELNEQKLEDCQ